MSYYIRVEGRDGQIAVPLENLIEMGVTKHTWICKENTEEWDIAENFRELDSIWETKKTDAKTYDFAKNKNEIAISKAVITQSTLPTNVSKVTGSEKISMDLLADEFTKITHDKPEFKNDLKSTAISEEEKPTNQNRKKNETKKAIDRMLRMVFFINVIFFGSKWFLSKISTTSSDKPSTSSEQKQSNDNNQTDNSTVLDFSPEDQRAEKIDNKSSPVSSHINKSDDTSASNKKEGKEKISQSSTEVSTENEERKPYKQREIEIKNFQRQLDALLDKVELKALTTDRELAKKQFEAIEGLLDSLPILNKRRAYDLANDYEREAKSLCDKYRKSNSTNLYYVPDDYYTYAAHLKQNKTSNKCQ